MVWRIHIGIRVVFGLVFEDLIGIEWNYVGS